MFSLIKVCKEVVRIYNRLWVNSSKSWRNVETKCVGTKCIGILNSCTRLLYESILKPEMAKNLCLLSVIWAIRPCFSQIHILLYLIQFVSICCHFYKYKPIRLDSCVMVITGVIRLTTIGVVHLLRLCTLCSSL